jgi:hypothetical protein
MRPSPSRAGVLLAGAVLLGGCAPDSTQSTAAGDSPAQGVTVSAAVVSPSPAASAVVPAPSRKPAPTDARIAPIAPEPADSPPPSAAGPLGMGNLPAAASLGAGFRTYDDPGGAESGFLGNGTWARAREPHQAAFEVQPVGCGRPLPDASMPVPRHALQGSYRNPRGLPAHALVLRFASSDQAATYFARYNALMKRCAPVRGAELGVSTLWSRDGATAFVRSYARQGRFTEVAVVSGASVGLVATSSERSARETAWTRAVAPRVAAVIDRL